jgi:hypothetical protein
LATLDSAGTHPTSRTSAGQPISPTVRSPTTPARGPDWLDDHSRYALSVTADSQLTGPIVLATSRATIASKNYVDMLGKLIIPSGSARPDLSRRPLRPEHRHHRYKVAGKRCMCWSWFQT